MIYPSGRTKRFIASFFAAMFLAVVMQFISDGGFPLLLVTSVIYGFIVITWAATVERRILQKEMRRMLLLASFGMVLLFLLRMGKYQLFLGKPDIERLLWYAYYVPMMAVAVLCLQASLCIGQSPEWIPSGRWRSLWFLSMILVLMVMTNDLHQMVFRFSGPPETWTEEYSYGPGYYAVYLWMILVMGTTLYMIARKGRDTGRRKLLWIPLLPLLLELVFSILVQRGGGHVPRLFGRSIFQFQEVFCFMVIAFWESCIQIGLVPCNSDYEAIFDLSSIRAEIADEDRNAVLQSANPLNLTREQRLEADREPVMIDQDRRVQGHPIRGGAVYWVDNIAGIRAIHEALRETGEQLSEEGTLIRARSRLTEQKARAEIENRLYDRMNEQVRPQLERIQLLLASDSLSEEEFRRNLRESMVLCAYIKRRSNLMLIADPADVIPSQELFLSVRESMENLAFTGVTAGADQSGEGPWPAAELFAAYDFLERVIEALPAEVTAFLAVVHTGETRELRLEFTLSGEDGAVSALRIPDTDLADAVRSAGGEIDASAEDETVYYTVVFGRKGGAA